MYYVYYCITGFTNNDGGLEFNQGPYDDFETAEMHARDIIGYEGVYGLRIVEQNEVH